MAQRLLLSIAILLPIATIAWLGSKLLDDVTAGLVLATLLAVTIAPLFSVTALGGNPARNNGR